MLLDKFVCQRGLGGVDHPLLGNIRLAVSDVVAHRVVEEDCLLGHLADLSAQGVKADVAQVMAVDHNANRGDIKKAWNQVDEGSLPCAAGADERDHFAAMRRSD